MRCFLLFLLIFTAAAQQPPRIIRRTDDKNASAQTLPQMKEPPAAVVAEASRLTFQISPLSSKGLLTPQTRDALKAIMHGGALVKVRAFVAGTGDLRRVQALMSEALAEKKEPLPALTVVQVGALPLEGAQVVLEGVSEEKKAVSPNGLEFFSGTPKETEAFGGEVVRVTCWLTSLDGVPNLRASLAAKFPHAAVNLVQALRDAADSPGSCEGVRRVASGGVSGKLLFSSLQMAFGEKDADLRLAFDRLEKTLAAQDAGFNQVVNSDVYALSAGAWDKGGAVARQFIPTARAPLFIENLPSIDASLGIEVVAAVRK